MSGSQQHPYHLVDPSPMPILTSFSLLLFVVGAALFLHEDPNGPFVFGAGVMSVIACCYFWWKDVVKEGMHDKAHNPTVQFGLRFGMGLFIISEVMFFFAFFWAYFAAAIFPILPLEELWGMGEGVWPPAGIHTFDPWDLPFINTLILLLSGTTVTWAHHALLHGDRDGLIKGLWCTVILGVCFTGLQAVEYSHAAFSLTDGIYATTFYLATGFHGLHVIIGTTFLAVCLVRASRDQFTTENHLGFEFAAWYWHFVDVVWLFLFVFVYWWGA
ncbi:MAG: cytochrome c oxidase subunit 3 [Rickettsiales bacterium]|nr:cytochrome c oxidase subunit 3 [Rickettsiales bacterium]